MEKMNNEINKVDLNHYNAYCVKDSLTNIFSVPTFSMNDNVAIRQFLRVYDVNSADFSLYKVASFDMLTGKFEALLEPEFLCTSVVKEK